METGYTHKLYGRRILHIMSSSGRKGNKHIVTDSNYKVMPKLLNGPTYVSSHNINPENHTIPDLGDNVTLVPFPYHQSVLFNRGFFHGRHLVKHTDWRLKDFDFVFNHQPELLYNVYNTIIVDMVCQQSHLTFSIGLIVKKQTNCVILLDFQTIRNIDLSYRSYFHCPVSLDYMKSNWDKIVIHQKVLMKK